MTPSKFGRLNGGLGLAIFFALFAIEPAYAQSLQPVENLTDFIVGFLTGTFARSVAIIAVAVLGYLGLSGRLRWAIAGSVILGQASSQRMVTTWTIRMKP